MVGWGSGAGSERKSIWNSIYILYWVFYEGSGPIGIVNRDLGFMDRGIVIGDRGQPGGRDRGS